MGLHFLTMLAVLSVPILLIAGLLLQMIKPLIRRGKVQAANENAPRPGPDVARYCGRCGGSLEPQWFHCPLCGSLVTGIRTAA